MVHYSQGNSTAFEEGAHYGRSFIYVHCPPQVAHYTLRTAILKKNLYSLPGISKCLATHLSGLWRNLLAVLVVLEVPLREPLSQRTPGLPPCRPFCAHSAPVGPTDLLWAENKFTKLDSLRGLELGQVPFHTRC